MQCLVVEQREFMGHVGSSEVLLISCLVIVLTSFRELFRS